MYTGNSHQPQLHQYSYTVYPCVYRELVAGEALVIGKQRFIPVYTGNSFFNRNCGEEITVYPCVYRELFILL